MSVMHGLLILGNFTLWWIAPFYRHHIWAADKILPNYHQEDISRVMKVELLAFVLLKAVFSCSKLV